MSRLVWLIPLFPLLGTIVNALFGRLIGHRAHWIAVPALGASFLAACAVFARVQGGETFTGDLFPWIAAGSFKTAIMLVVVTSVSLLVQVYSQGYMAGDGGYSRYFAYMSLFTASMLGLVLVDSILVLFVFWELVGLCSYLLIGFWFHRPAAARAAVKAFFPASDADCFWYQKPMSR